MLFLSLTNYVTVGNLVKPSHSWLFISIALILPKGDIVIQNKTLKERYLGHLSVINL